VAGVFNVSVSDANSFAAVAVASELLSKVLPPQALPAPVPPVAIPDPRVRPPAVMPEAVVVAENGDGPKLPFPPASVLKSQPAIKSAFAEYEAATVTTPTAIAIRVKYRLLTINSFIHPTSKLPTLIPNPRPSADANGFQSCSHCGPNGGRCNRFIPQFPEPSWWFGVDLWAASSPAPAVPTEKPGCSRSTGGWPHAASPAPCPGRRCHKPFDSNGLCRLGKSVSPPAWLGRGQSVLRSGASGHRPGLPGESGRRLQPCKCGRPRAAGFARLRRRGPSRSPGASQRRVAPPLFPAFRKILKIFSDFATHCCSVRTITIVVMRSHTHIC
jgi:hypothetical protein